VPQIKAVVGMSKLGWTQQEKCIMIFRKLTSLVNMIEKNSSDFLKN